MKPIFVGYSESGEKLELTSENLQTHAHGVGASRTGKSKLIEWIARELIRNEQGFCLIDPDGVLYNDLASWLAYLDPQREIILFNPSSQSKIVGFNPFRRGEGHMSVQVDRRVAATMKVFGEAIDGKTKRLVRWLKCVYHLLIEQGFSLEVAPFLLNWKEKQMRQFLIETVEDRVILNEWKDVASYPENQFRDQSESTRNRLFSFLTSETIRRTMGLPINNIDLKDIIEGGKILLVNLQPSDFLSDENARIIGTLLVNEIWEVAKRRAQNSTVGAPPSFFLIIDEFQKYLTPDIPTILNGGAKYGLHLFLFHQHLHQLRTQDEQIYSAVMTNARAKFVFGGLTREDARLMAENIFPGQVDLHRVKFFLEQTKFWPVYTREAVYSSSSGHSSSHGITTGQAWDPSERAWVTSTTDALGGVDSANEGMADVPFLYPVPFQEVSSVTPYSLEEMLWLLSDRLMEQYQRHFMIRLPGKETLAAVTPFVKSWYVKSECVADYTEKTTKGFLTAGEVDESLRAINDKLRNRANDEPTTAKRRVKLPHVN